MEKRRPTINLSIFTTLSETFSSPNPTKSPRNFENGVVGLGIVAAMTDLSDELNIVSPRSSPIPIVTCAKATTNFRSALNLERENENDKFDDEELDEESYTCVISHVGNNMIKKRVYFGDKVDVDDCCGVFDTFPLMNGVVGEVKKEFWSDSFLNSCDLCNKLLHGLDIFMYRGEKAFCSWECREKQIRSDDCKEKCGSAARKQLNYSVSPCSGPLVFLAGVAAA